MNELNSTLADSRFCGLGLLLQSTLTFVWSRYWADGQSRCKQNIIISSSSSNSSSDAGSRTVNKLTVKWTCQRVRYGDAKSAIRSVRLQQCTSNSSSSLLLLWVWHPDAKRTDKIRAGTELKRLYSSTASNRQTERWADRLMDTVSQRPVWSRCIITYFHCLSDTQTDGHMSWIAITSSNTDWFS